MRKLPLFLAVLSIGFLITSILTWPFITKLNTFYKDSADYTLMTSILWYNHQNWGLDVVLNQENYYRGYQFYPQPNTIAFGDNLITLSFISSIFFWLTNNFILSVNLMIIFNFILSFIAGFYLINYLIKSPWASIFGALVMTFNPLILTQYPDHIFGLFSLFLVFLFAFKLVNKPEIKDAILLGIGLVLMSFTNVYLLVFSMLALSIIFLPFLIWNIYTKNKKCLISAAKFFLLGLFFIPIMLYVSKPYTEFSKNEQVTRTVNETLFFSARVQDWFSANPNSLIYGAWVKSYEKNRAPGVDFNGQFNYREHTLFLNIIPSLLFIIGFIYIFKRFKKTDLSFKLLIIGLTLLLLTSFILTFGPYFMSWNGNTSLFKLPFYYLFENIFFLKGMRVPARFQMVFYIPFAIILSYGVYLLKTQIKKKIIFYLLTVLLFTGLILENFNLQNFSDKSINITKLQNSAFQKKIHFLSGKKILHLPIHIPELGEWSFYTLNWGIITNSISLNGISGYAPPDQLNFLIKLKSGISEEELKELYIIKTDYIVIHKNLLSKEHVKYSKDWNLYKKGSVYEDSELMIVDLKKYDFRYQVCNFDNDFQKNITKAIMKDVTGEFYVLVLKNNKDCYLPSIYKEKYRQLKFQTSFLGTWDHTAFYRTPVIIRPKEQVVLSEMSNNLRIDL